MSWFFIALCAPLLWSLVNHIDKYLISKYVKGGGTGAIVIFTSVFSIVLLPIILSFEPGIFRIPPEHALVLLGVGALNALAALLFLTALHEDDASVVVPFFQTIPLFGLLFGYVFLGETLTTHQAIAGLIIIAGACMLSLDISEDRKEKGLFKKKIVFLMLGSSALYALFETIYKTVAIHEGFWVSNFWQYLGLTLTGIALFLAIKPYRKEFLEILRKNGWAAIGLNALGESLNMGASLLLTLATLMAPLALAQLANAYQPFFVLIIGILLTVFLPTISQENLKKEQLTQKIVAIALIFIGSMLIF